MSAFHIKVTTSGSNATAIESEPERTVQTRGEFYRFEELTKKLINVSKTELDERLRQD